MALGNIKSIANCERFADLILPMLWTEIVSTFIDYSIIWIVLHLKYLMRKMVHIKYLLAIRVNSAIKRNSKMSNRLHIFKCHNSHESSTWQSKLLHFKYSESGNVHRSVNAGIYFKRIASVMFIIKFRRKNNMNRKKLWNRFYWRTW